MVRVQSDGPRPEFAGTRTIQVGLKISSVNPGFGGQSFIPTVEAKIRTLRKAIDEQVANGGRQVQLQIDGGVKSHNIAMLQEWGVTNAVVGSGLFNSNASVADNLATIDAALQ